VVAYWGQAQGLPPTQAVNRLSLLSLRLLPAGTRVAKDESPLLVGPGDKFNFLNQMIPTQAYAAVRTHGDRILRLAGLGMLEAFHGKHLLSQIVQSQLGFVTPLSYLGMCCFVFTINAR
jgi:hypothetical protein